MAIVQNLTITLPQDLAVMLEAEVSGGRYGSMSDIIKEALNAWSTNKQSARERLDALRRDLDEGLADIEAGRVVDVDLDDIMDRGRQKSRHRGASA